VGKEARNYRWNGSDKRDAESSEMFAAVVFKKGPDFKSVVNNYAGGGG